MRRALLVTDVEGLAGVTMLEARSPGTGAHLFARSILTQVVNAIVRGLREAGYEQVRVFDSLHRDGSGPPTVVADQLHPDAELLGSTGAFAPHLFDEVEAVACVGMHPPGGASGFGAHTVVPGARWRLGERLVSEADLLLDLAAERGVPYLFVGGKPGAASVAVFGEPSLDALEGLARTSDQKPAPRLPSGPLTLDFHTHACADAAGRVGAQRVGPRSVTVDGATSRERYERALQTAEAGWSAFAPAVADGPPGWMQEDLDALFALPWEPAQTSALDAHRSLEALRADTADGSEESRGLWALSLHLVKGIAPRFFAAEALDGPLKAALDALALVPRALEVSLGGDALEARFDAIYLEHLYGRRKSPLPQAAAVRAALEGLERDGDPIYAWLLGELAARFGVDERLPLGPREFRGASRPLDLYQLAHLVLLNTDYLMRPAAHPDAPVWAASLVAATPLVVAQQATDLAGELVIALLALGEHTTPAVSHLLAMMARFFGPDGRLVDPTAPRGAHPTAVALVASAAAEEWYRPVAENSQDRSSHVRS